MTDRCGLVCLLTPKTILFSGFSQAARLDPIVPCPVRYSGGQAQGSTCSLSPCLVEKSSTRLFVSYAVNRLFAISASLASPYIEAFGETVRENVRLRNLIYCYYGN